MSEDETTIRSARPARPAQGVLRVPGDKSISHRVAILGGLARGRTVVDGYLRSEDCLNTLHAMEQLGAGVEFLADGKIAITGREGKLVASDAPVDCGNSGTGMRLMAGMLAAQPLDCLMVGDASLSSRPMGRIMKPLEAMGARLEALGEKPGCAPLRVRGTTLKPVNWQMEVASAQVKSCVLLAGMQTPGATTVTQPEVTRDHTERLFAHFGIDLAIDGNTMTVTGPQIPTAADITVPGDISSAAFWLVAAAAQPGSDLVLENVGLNPTRTAILDVLKRMGADISVTPKGGLDSEPFGDIRIRGGQLSAFTVQPEEVPNLIDEVPVLAVAAALASGRSEIRNARELRVKETDRIATVASNLRLMGAEVEEFDDGLAVTGPVKLRGAAMRSFGDHRIAMAFLVAGLFAEGETTMSGCGCIATSYPGFEDHFRQVSGQS